jgi:phosphotriesterase-related protein
MTKLDVRDKAQTVLGLVNGNELGITLPHEHLFTDISFHMVEPTEPELHKLAHEKISPENLWFARHHMFSSEDNMVLDDEDLAIREATYFREAGGKTIVDLTPIGVGRNPAGLVNVAKSTGLNIIMGTSYYIALSHEPEMGMQSKTRDNIAEEFIREIREGVGDTGIKAGLIGEIGCSWPLEDVEKKVLQAAAIVQQATGAAICIHPGAYEGAPLEHVQLLKEVGADLSRVIISHMTRSIPSDAKKTRSKLAEKGCYLAFDLFGREGCLPASLISGYDRVTDVTRIYQIMDLIRDGFLEQILISHDRCFKVMLRSYGGGGYSFILKNTIPEMLKKGIIKEQIHTILVENPKRVLTFA